MGFIPQPRAPSIIRVRVFQPEHSQTTDGTAVSKPLTPIRSCGVYGIFDGGGLRQSEETLIALVQVGCQRSHLRRSAQGFSISSSMRNMIRTNQTERCADGEFNAPGLQRVLWLPLRASPRVKSSRSDRSKVTWAMPSGGSFSCPRLLEGRRGEQQKPHTRLRCWSYPMKSEGLDSGSH